MEIVWAPPACFGERAFTALAGVLDDDEQARAARLTFEEDRRAFVAAHGLLRLALSRAAPQRPHEWRFVSDSRGKPRIAGETSPELGFSMAHTRSLVACVVAPGEAVGLDVEEIPGTEPDAPLLATCCSRAEIARLYERPAPLRALEFTRLWTLKEAAAKAVGAGLEGLAERFEFTRDDKLQPNDFASEAEARAWAFATLRPTERHIIALARPTDAGAPEATLCAADDAWVTFALTLRDA